MSNYSVLIVGRFWKDVKRSTRLITCSKETHIEENDPTMFSGKNNSKNLIIRI